MRTRAIRRRRLCESGKVCRGIRFKWGQRSTTATRSFDRKCCYKFTAVVTFPQCVTVYQTFATEMCTTLTLTFRTGQGLTSTLPICQYLFMPIESSHVTLSIESSHVTSPIESSHVTCYIVADRCLPYHLRYISIELCMILTWSG